MKDNEHILERMTFWSNMAQAAAYRDGCAVCRGEVNSKFLAIRSYCNRRYGMAWGDARFNNKSLRGVEI